MEGVGGSCIRCGQCCERFSIPTEDVELAMQKMHDRDFADCNLIDLFFMNFFIEWYEDEDRNDGLGWYRCLLFDRKRRVCPLHNIGLQPKICSGYGQTYKPDFREGCGYFPED